MAPDGGPQRTRSARRQAHIVTAPIAARITVEVLLQVLLQIAWRTAVAVPCIIALPTRRQEAVRIEVRVPVQIGRRVAVAIAPTTGPKTAIDVTLNTAFRTTSGTVPGTVPTVTPEVSFRVGVGGSNRWYFAHLGQFRLTSLSQTPVRTCSDRLRVPETAIPGIPNSQLGLSVPRLLPASGSHRTCDPPRP